MRLALPLQTLLPAVGFVPRAPVPLPLCCGSPSPTSGRIRGGDEVRPSPLSGSGGGCSMAVTTDVLSAGPSALPPPLIS